MDKNILRTQLLAKRRDLESDYVRQASLEICNKAISQIDWTKINTVNCYQSQSTLGEVDTSFLLDYIRNQKPHIVLDIAPTSRTSQIPTKKYDPIIVPVVAFDREGNRIGMGGGWYDRFLATQPQATKIGLAYDWQEVDSIPSEQHDIALDKVISS